MSEKLIIFTVPCYNSEAYMCHWSYIFLVIGTYFKVGWMPAIARRIWVFCGFRLQLKSSYFCNSHCPPVTAVL